MGLIDYTGTYTQIYMYKYTAAHSEIYVYIYRYSFFMLNETFIVIALPRNVFTYDCIYTRCTTTAVLRGVCIYYYMDYCILSIRSLGSLQIRCRCMIYIYIILLREFFWMIFNCSLFFSCENKYNKEFTIFIIVLMWWYNLCTNYDFGICIYLFLLFIIFYYYFEYEKKSKINILNIITI